MGQVYLVKDKDDEKVIIKVLRPGVEKRAEAEFTLLRSLTEDEGVLKFISELEESFLEEADFNTERENIRNGQFYHGQMKGKLKVIQVLEGYKESQKVLFISCAEGQSIEKFNANYNGQKIEALKEFLYVWAQEAIFGHRIFHADLHPGNIFFHVNEDDYSFFGSGNDFVMTLIDFGSIGSFTLKEAKSLFKIMAGLSQCNKSLVMKGLVEIADWKEGVEESTLEQLVEEVFSADLLDSEKSKLLFDKALELGILLPKSFIQFYRGEAFLEKQLVELYEKEYGPEEGKAEAELAIANVFQSVFKWSIFWDLCLTNSGDQNNDQCFVDNDVILSLLGY